MHAHQQIQGSLNGMSDTGGKYFDVSEVMSQHCFTKKSKCKVMHHNVQGLQSKFDDFNIYISQIQTQDEHPDVILLCKTFLNDNNANLFNIDGYRVYK